MSVLKNKRSVSKLEFYHNAIELRKEITDLLLRDFGIKNKVRSINAILTNPEMDEEDKKIVEDLIKKYENLGIVVYGYPEWLIEQMRDKMLNICHNMIMNITQANTIYPVSEAEYNDRRQYQNHAIGNCEPLLQEMQYAISVLPIDAQKLMKYVDMIEREIALLKGWRKSDNKILERIRKGVVKKNPIVEVLEKILDVLVYALIQPKKKD